MDLRKIIEKKRDSAKYMVEEITYICKNIEKRSPARPVRKKHVNTWQRCSKRTAAVNVPTSSLLRKIPAHFTAGCFLLSPLCLRQ